MTLTYEVPDMDSRRWCCVERAIIAPLKVQHYVLPHRSVPTDFSPTGPVDLQAESRTAGAGLACREEDHLVLERLEALVKHHPRSMAVTVVRFDKGTPWLLGTVGSLSRSHSRGPDEDCLRTVSA